MTVAELIDVLRKMPQDAVVWFCCDNTPDAFGMRGIASKVEHIEEQNQVYLLEED